MPKGVRCSHWSRSADRPTTATCRILLKLNARMTDGHFAIRVLRGEEYFVVIENLPVETAASVDPAAHRAGSPSLPMASKIGSRGGATSTDEPDGVPLTRPAAKIRPLR